MVPLLLRGLRERATTIRRQTCKIIDNMVQLVDDPADAECFLPLLLPGLEKAANEIADPEARTVAVKAFATLKRVSGHGKAEEQKLHSAAPKKVEQQVGPFSDFTVVPNISREFRTEFEAGCFAWRSIPLMSGTVSCSCLCVCSVRVSKDRRSIICLVSCHWCFGCASECGSS